MARRPFHYEDPEFIERYNEFGSDRVAHISEEKITSDEFQRLMDKTSSMNVEETISWIIENSNTFSPKTFITDTKNGRNLQLLSGHHPEAFVILRPLNEIIHLNTFLNTANETLADGGYIWCHCTTAALRKQEILRKWPPVINLIAYTCHYLWHRVMPKMRITRWFYFWVTGGKQRVYHRVEALGRLYRAGFEVIDETFRQGHFFLTARKCKAPIKDDEPTGSPLIKLRRVGKDGKLIGVYKFRTMYSYSEYLQPYIYKFNKLAEGGKFADDYRVNGWGRVMRKFWLDEIPMLINVFKGDLKIVGVRPLSQHYFSLYSPMMQELRVKVKPGLLPPFYYDKTRPKTIEDVQESEKRYIEAYLEHPFRTDWRYFWGTMKNILLKGARSK